MRGLTDEENDATAALAAPLPPSLRAAFLQTIAHLIVGYPPQPRGPGFAYRHSVAQAPLLATRLRLTPSSSIDKSQPQDGNRPAPL
jgi:hypothetical protein